jgi:murein DD-endopeptidase MepM/ murein hydrolase activator NlpD
MKIQAPIKGFIKSNAPYGSISQYFGENPEMYSKICHPINGKNTCMIGHNGIDIIAPWYTPLLAVQDGVVTDIKFSPDGYGKHIRFNAPFNGMFGREWTYGHLAEFHKDMHVGKRVKAGDVLGYMGNTGFVVSSHDGNGFWKAGSNQYAGTHLHLGLREYNAQGHVLNYSNGYFGSIDFIDLLPDDGINHEQMENEKVGILMKQVIWALGKIGYKIDLTK